ncbi:hypothetical protein PCC7418_2438 [Halothece sp. PCC 7418]|nr:hypothetical protein PCC7418_2438 [Halothece sp. PCC 7418]
MIQERLWGKRINLLLLLSGTVSLFLNLCCVNQASANPTLAEELDLDPTLIENSPVLQRWGQEIPDLSAEMSSDPSFDTRFQVGYVQYPSGDQISGWIIGVEDIFLGRNGVTVSVGYSESFNHDRAHFKSDFSYSLLPLGNYFNVAPVMGYHALETEDYQEDGLNLGLQVRLILSRTGAADIRLTQSFISPTTETEVGLTNLAIGYSLTKQLRLNVEIEKQNARQAKESRVGILTQWQFP